MKTFRHLFLPASIIMSLLLSGCAIPLTVPVETHKQHYKESTNASKGEVYIYREKGGLGILRGIYVTADGVRIGALNSGTYFVYEVSPGKHVFSVEDWLGDDPSREIDIEAGKNYYLRGSLKFGMIDAAPHIMIVYEPEGDAAINELTYSTMK